MRTRPAAGLGLAVAGACPPWLECGPGNKEENERDLINHLQERPSAHHLLARTCRSIRSERLRGRPDLGVAGQGLPGLGKPGPHLGGKPQHRGRLRDASCGSDRRDNADLGKPGGNPRCWKDRGRARQLPGAGAGCHRREDRVEALGRQYQRRSPAVGEPPDSSRQPWPIEARWSYGTPPRSCGGPLQRPLSSERAHQMPSGSR